MCLKSGMALDASCRAAVVRTARAECRVLNQAAASDASLALNTQLCTASGLCNSNVRPSEKTKSAYSNEKKTQISGWIRPQHYRRPHQS